MLSRRNREPPASRTEPTSFAARAKDLGALRDAVVDAASVGTGLWLSYLFFLFYFAIAAGAVTHRDLLLENPVKLPFLNVELPLKAFFVLGPLVFIIVHAYVLLHFVLLAAKIGAFHSELEWQVKSDDTRAHLRRQLPSNIFVQFIAGPREVREGTIGFLLRQVAQISLVAGPIALLILFQLQFLPYHSEWITNWQRAAVVIDLLLLWFLWPPIARGETNLLAWREFTRVKVLAWMLASTLPVLLVGTIATFPGEWLEDKLPSLSFIPVGWLPWMSKDAAAKNSSLVARGWPWIRERAETRKRLESRQRWTSLHELLVAGEVNYVTGRPQSLWSNVLVLPNFEAGDRIKFDAEGKIAISSANLSLRGRSLEGAVFVSAHLRKADFAGAQLARADFTFADMREAKFECSNVGSEEKCVQLGGASLNGAQLQGASLKGAQLQGASLKDSQLQGASFSSLRRLDQNGILTDYRSELQGADLGGAQLQGASLIDAQLQGADLGGAQLQGALLKGAQFQGALLGGAQLQGVSLAGAGFQNADLSNVYVWRAEPPSSTAAAGALVTSPNRWPRYQGLDCGPGAISDIADVDRVCDWSETSFAVLKSLIENNVPAGSLRDGALQRIASLKKPPYFEDEPSAKAWAELEEISSHSGGLYYETSLKTLETIGCASDGAPYVVGGLIPQLNGRFGDRLSQETPVLSAFLDEAKCPGVRGLPEEIKSQLKQIRDEFETGFR
jgi:uncharacterized protein YjbI with pentapeptide repeats